MARLAPHLALAALVSLALAVPSSAAAAPFFGAPTSFWNRPLPDDVATVPSETAAAASDLVSEIGVYRAIVNTTRYSGPITVVGPGTPLVPVQLMRPSWKGVVPRYDLTLAAVLAAGVPIPTGWQPAAADDTDAQGVF